jgi:16S rRNA C1402 N4-methylase RsmH
MVSNKTRENLRDRLLEDGNVVYREGGSSELYLVSFASVYYKIVSHPMFTMVKKSEQLEFELNYATGIGEERAKRIAKKTLTGEETEAHCNASPSMSSINIYDEGDYANLDIEWEDIDEEEMVNLTL